MNQSLQYAQTHSDEVRAAAAGGVAEHPAADLDDARRSATDPRPRALREEVRRHHLAPQPDPARAELDLGRVDASGHGRRAVHHSAPGRQGDRHRSRPGSTRSSSPTARRSRASRSSGPGVNKRTGVSFVGRTTWTVNLKKGTYAYSSSPPVREADAEGDLSKRRCGRSAPSSARSAARWRRAKSFVCLLEPQLGYRGGNHVWPAGGWEAIDVGTASRFPSGRGRLGAPARRAIAISSSRSSPTTSVRRGVVPSARHASRSAAGDGLPRVTALTPVVWRIPAATAPDHPGAARR